MVDSRSDLTSGLTIADSGSGLVAVELYTQHHKVAGQLARGNVRISDVFDQVERSHLTIQNVTITTLLRAREPVAVEEILLNVRSVVLVIPHEPRIPLTTTNVPRQLIHVEKQRHRVVVEVPPFSITGAIHLVRETKLRDALLAISSQFIPLTAATISIHGVSGEPFASDTVIVNRSFLQIMYPTPSPVRPTQQSGILLKRAR